MLSLEKASKGFAAVGSEPRLSVLLTLVRAGEEGLSVGEIQEKLGMAASTLAHHLRSLSTAKLIRQEKRGREVINKADYDRLKLLSDFLLSECCKDAPDAD